MMTDFCYLLLFPYYCLVHVRFNVLKLSSNLESLFSFEFSAEHKSDGKEYLSLLLNFEAFELRHLKSLKISQNAKFGQSFFSAEN